MEINSDITFEKESTVVRQYLNPYLQTGEASESNIGPNKSICI